MEKRKAVGVWVRVSTEDQARGDSLEHHTKRAEAYAATKDWNIVTTYVLEAVSGKVVMQHPEAKRMLEDVRDGKITGLIFSKLARLARSTKALLEFSEIFKACGADLISLGESIDTTTPAGRMFFTVQAALTEFEREEIAERVAASVPIRAKLGKSLGGAAPFGYRWEGKTSLVIDETEAPIRKLMYELFVKYKRKMSVSMALNERGYRTRNGSEFTDTTIDRLLRDPIAKGIRRANYTKSRGEKKHWDIKPEKEWVLAACPAIISEELWNTCNGILDEQEASRKPRTRSTVHLFSGFITCGCGAKMYVPSRTNKYTCTKCKKTRIDVTDLEEIYFEQLKTFLLGNGDLATFENRANDSVQKKETEMKSLKKQKDDVKFEMDKLIKLHLKDQLKTERFKEYFDPLDAQYKQLDESFATVEGQLDYLKIQKLNGIHILDNAENLYQRWPTLDTEVKRGIVEELTDSIVIENEDISITFGYNPVICLPIIFLNPPKPQRNPALAGIITTPKKNAYVHRV